MPDVKEIEAPEVNPVAVGETTFAPALPEVAPTTVSSLGSSTLPKATSKAQHVYTKKIISILKSVGKVR